MIVAVLMSITMVGLASAIGRGTLNLRGALLLDEPRDTTVIALVEPKLADKVTISGIEFLRKSPADRPSSKQMYSYNVTTSDDGFYLTQIVFSDETKQWTIAHFETLHAGASASAKN